jgi:hypothetical protein
MTENKPDYGYTEDEAYDILENANFESFLGLPVRSKRDYGRDVAGLFDYLSQMACGKHFSMREVVIPHHKTIAKKCGYTAFVPPIHLWPFVGIVLMLGDLMRDVVGRPVRLRNLWRPVPYNIKVAHTTRAKSLKGDHSNACAGDFDFQDVSDRRKAEGAMRAMSIQHPELKMSLGMGLRTLHVGVLSPRGHRHWFYPSYGKKERRVKVK